MRIFDPVAGGEALLVLDVVVKLAVFTDPATGEPRLACGVTIEDSGQTQDWESAHFRPGRGRCGAGRARCRLKVNALAVFTDPATGAPRLERLRDSDSDSDSEILGACLRSDRGRRRAARARHWF